MRERPQQDLLDALGRAGIDAVSEQSNGCPPLIVRSTGSIRGGKIAVGGEVSSQFVSALLMVAPYAAADVALGVTGRLRPHYVEITRRMMAQWGVEAAYNAPGYHVEAGQRYVPQPDYRIEPDASSASYFFAAAAITGGRVTVRDLHRDALQGDVKFATEVLAEMGCGVTDDADGLTVEGPPAGRLRGVTRDMSAISDTSLTLAAIAPFASSPTTVSGIAHARLQECDRIAAACEGLSRLGVRVLEHPDGFTVYPSDRIRAASIRSFDDHRVAMSFALVGLVSPGIVIGNPGCVAKTFPGYWDTLESIRNTE
jgi:3-phosphoshikimate 1-carboxyvinyltransferase